MKNTSLSTLFFLVLISSHGQADQPPAVEPEASAPSSTTSSQAPAPETTPAPVVTISVAPVTESTQTLKILNALVQEAETTSLAGRKKPAHCDMLYKSISSLIEISSHLSLLAGPKAVDDLAKDVPGSTRGVLSKPLSKSDIKQLGQNLAMMKTTHRVKHNQLQTTFTGLSCAGEKSQITTAKNLESSLTQIEYFLGVLAK